MSADWRKANFFLDRCSPIGGRQNILHFNIFHLAEAEFFFRQMFAVWRKAKYFAF